LFIFGFTPAREQLQHGQMRLRENRSAKKHSRLHPYGSEQNLAPPRFCNGLYGSEQNLAPPRFCNGLYGSEQNLALPRLVTAGGLASGSPLLLLGVLREVPHETLLGSLYGKHPVEDAS
jgi:hypothetical protein